MAKRSRNWHKAVFTHEADEHAGHLYYFAPLTTAPGPYLEQRRVTAIIDIASDGTLAGVELIDEMPPPTPTLQENSNA